MQRRIFSMVVRRRNSTSDIIGAHYVFFVQEYGSRLLINTIRYFTLEVLPYLSFLRVTMENVGRAWLQEQYRVLCASLVIYSHVFIIVKVIVCFNVGLTPKSCVGCRHVGVGSKITRGERRICW